MDIAVDLQKIAARIGRPPGSPDGALTIQRQINFEEAEAKRRAEQRQKWDAEDAAQEKARAAARAELQREADEELKAAARADFMLANPGASEADFTRLWPRMRDDLMVARAAGARDREVEGLMRKFGSSI